MRKNNFYCLSCKKAVLPEGDPKLKKIYNKRRHGYVPMLKDKCSKCGGKVCKIIG